MGRTPLALEAQRLSIKNWERIKNENGNLFVTKSYENAYEKILDWNESIVNLVSRHGMQYKLTETATNICNAVFGKAKDVFHQEAFYGIEQAGAKLRTYSLIKHKIGREDYLEQIKNTKHRQQLTKFRLSNHKLRIEVGRHMNLPKEERICEICNEGIEDEIHFLVKCDLYKTLRKPLVDICTELRPQFGFYSDQEKFVFLMTTSLLMGNVSKFIDSALKDRDTYLETSKALNCLLDKVSSLVP